MLIDVNKWIDKNGSFDEAGGLDLVRHGYEWIRRMRKFENKADRHTFQKVFGNKRGNELWDCFLEVGKSIFILEDSYFLINDRNVFSLCLAECSDYDLYELVHNIETDSDQGKFRPKNVLKRARAFLRQDYQYMMFLSHYMGSFQ